MAHLFSAANLASVAGIFGIFCCYVDAFRPLSKETQPPVKRSEDAAKILEDERKVMELFREVMILEGIRDSFKKERNFYLERKRVLRCQLDALENEKNGKVKEHMPCAQHLRPVCSIICCQLMDGVEVKSLWKPDAEELVLI